MGNNEKQKRRKWETKCLLALSLTKNSPVVVRAEKHTESKSIGLRRHDTISSLYYLNETLKLLSSFVVLYVENIFNNRGKDPNFNLNVIFSEKLVAYNCIWEETEVKICSCYKNKNICGNIGDELSVSYCIFLRVRRKVSSISQ